MAVQFIGLGPFFPKSVPETIMIMMAILFGMIWNIWFFYGLTGGWWVDKSTTVCEFEDQMGIIDMYITVAKQKRNADKIKR